MTETASRPSAPRYASLQIGRAIAILAVLATHAKYVANDVTAKVWATPDALDFAWAGVDLFFVISGFVIALLVDGKPITPRKFFTRRLIRIVPFYWFFTAIWLALMLAAGKLPTAAHAAASFAIFPLEDMPILLVGWSLEHEFVFYGIVAILLWLGRFRALTGVLATLFVVGIVVHVLLPELGGQRIWDFHLVSLYHFQFMLGVILFYQRHRIGRLDWRLLLALGIAGFPLTAQALHTLFGDYHMQTYAIGAVGLVRVVGFGIASAFLLAGLIAAEAQRAASFDTPVGAALIRLGDAFYGLYLLHPIVNAVLGAAARGRRIRRRRWRYPSLSSPGPPRSPARSAGIAGWRSPISIGCTPAGCASSPSTGPPSCADAPSRSRRSRRCAD